VVCHKENSRERFKVYRINTVWNIKEIKKNTCISCCDKKEIGPKLKYSLFPPFRLHNLTYGLVGSKNILFFPSTIIKISDKKYLSFAMFLTNI
jgi:hypothetical protein